MFTDFFLKSQSTAKYLLNQPCGLFSVFYPKPRERQLLITVKDNIVDPDYVMLMHQYLMISFWISVNMLVAAV